VRRDIHRLKSHVYFWESDNEAYLWAAFSAIVFPILLLVRQAAESGRKEAMKTSAPDGSPQAGWILSLRLRAYRHRMAAAAALTMIVVTLVARHYRDTLRRS